MIRLTREVRFGVNDALAPGDANAYAGRPGLSGAGRFFVLEVCLEGEPDPQSGYLINIKAVDDAVRQTAVPLITSAVEQGRFGGGGRLLVRLFDAMRVRFEGRLLRRLRLRLSPYICLEAVLTELPMVRLCQKFEFSASHRLHNPALSDEQNRAVFGKCNNPLGHGHNYEVEVTVIGDCDDSGQVVPVPMLERIVAGKVIERLDHKNLNAEVEEFRTLNPSVENIARVIYRLLAGEFRGPARLERVTVWETPKTWAEYSEPPVDGPHSR